MTLVDRRIGILFLAFAGLLGFAAIRAVELGTLKAGSLRSAAKTQQVQTVTVPAPRGTITDRSGVQLAITESADDVAADPLLIRKGHPEGAAQKLAPLLGKPPATVEAQITKPHTGFVYLAHLLPGDVARQIAALRINGITLIPQIKRVYPRGGLASQVLGTVEWNGKGASGIEYRYDSVLRGKDGVRKIVNAGNGQAISIDQQRPTESGRNVQLTIDTPLQDEVEQVLTGVGSQYQPKGATAIVMDPHSGAILALANWPKANPDNPAGASPSAFQDQAVGLNYEPGSTFNAITVAGSESSRRYPRERYHPWSRREPVASTAAKGPFAFASKARTVARKSSSTGTMVSSETTTSAPRVHPPDDRCTYPTGLPLRMTIR